MVPMYEFHVLLRSKLLLGISTIENEKLVTIEKYLPNNFKNPWKMVASANLKNIGTLKEYLAEDEYNEMIQKLFEIT